MAWGSSTAAAGIHHPNSGGLTVEQHVNCSITHFSSLGLNGSSRQASPSGGGGAAHKTVKGEQEEAARERPPPSGWLQRIPHVPPTGHTRREAGGIGLQEPKGASVVNQAVKDIAL
ncbi:hypothetical protein AOLI_G00143130 [Acnodon oligacanthus]